MRFSKFITILTTFLLPLAAQQITREQAAAMGFSGLPASSTSYTQTSTSKGSNYNFPMNSAIDFAEQNSSQISATSSTINLAGKEDRYIVGAGDQLTAFIWTTQEEEITIPVNSSGRAIIPTIGTISVSNLTLEQVQDTISTLLKTRYRNADIDIFLSQAKQVSVPVFGEVANPGIYVVDGTMLITELLTLAGGINETANPRTVSIVNDVLGDSDPLDLFRAYRIENEEVPFVRSGDKIFIAPRRDIVTLNGAINYPSDYDFIEHETVAEVIKAAGGFTRDVDSTRILVTRFINDLDSIVRFELNYELAETFELQRDDYVFVPEQKNFRVTRQVTISGEVTYPGNYAVREDKTRLIDLIGLAGGLTDDAYLAGSKIERTEFTDAGASEQMRLENLSPAGLSPDEKNYLKYRTSTQNGRLSISFEDLLLHGEEINNIILRNGDSIHIARRGLSVNVMGAVVNPGLITYKDGADFDYYVTQAGGFQEDAEKRRMKVIKGGSGTWLEVDQVDNIEIGDAIWIPEKPYVDRLQRTRDILGIIASIAGIIVAGLAVANYFDDK